MRMGDTDILSLSTEIVSSEEFKEPVNCKQITSFLEFLSEVEKAIRKVPGVYVRVCVHTCMHDIVHVCVHVCACVCMCSGIESMCNPVCMHIRMYLIMCEQYVHAYNHVLFELPVKIAP